MKPAPVITVGMPVFNGGQYLRRAVASIVQQSFTDWELLIIDDGSTDDSLETMCEFQDIRIHVLRDGLNKGLAARLNQAIGLARGRYFARMDHDDVAFPERFAHQVAALERDPMLDLVGVRCIAIDPRDRIAGYFPYALDHASLCAQPWRSIYLAHPTWMGRIEWFRHHQYAEPAPYLSEDMELLLRSYAVSHFATIPEILLAYRVRDHVAWSRMFRTRLTVLQVQWRHFSAARQWRFAALSVFAFVARLAVDMRNALGYGAGRTLPQRFRGDVDQDTQRQWQAVLQATNPVANTMARGD